MVHKIIISLFFIVVLSSNSFSQSLGLFPKKNETAPKRGISRYISIIDNVSVETDESKQDIQNKDKLNIFELNDDIYFELGKHGDELDIDNESIAIEDSREIQAPYIEDLATIKHYITVIGKNRLPFEVTEVEERKTFASLFDLIYINTYSKSRNDLKRGDKFVIYEPLGKISPWAPVYRTAGIGEIVGFIEHKNKNTTCIVQIINSFEAIKLGYKAESYTEPKSGIIDHYRKKSSSINGKIIYLSDNMRFSGTGYMCIVNLGYKDKVKTGDIVDIVRIKTGLDFTHPYKIGEAQIIKASDDYSSILIIDNELEIKKGDYVSLSKVAVFKEHGLETDIDE